MRIGMWDVEASPDGSWHYGPLYKQSISPHHVREVGSVISFAWKWYGEDKPVRVWDVEKHGKEALLQKAWDLLSEADAMVSWNGTEYDTPKIATDFWLADMPQPAPYREIDLYRAAKKRFRMPSNSLDFVARLKGWGKKLDTEGMVRLWMKMIDPDPAVSKKAWRKLRWYNRGDVLLLEPAYEDLKAWTPKIPSFGAFTGEDVCPACGGRELEPQGFAYLTSGKYQRYRCRDCSKWSRSSRRMAGTSLVEVAV